MAHLPASPVLSLDLRLGRQQHLADPHVAAQRRHVQRRAASAPLHRPGAARAQEVPQGAQAAEARGAEDVGALGLRKGK